MNDLVRLERLIADVAAEAAGPSRPVDVAAITRAATTQSPKWRFQSMFNATKFVVAAAIVALFGGFLLAGVVTEQPSEDSAPAAAASAPASAQDADAPVPNDFGVLITGYALDEPPAMSQWAEDHADTGSVTVTGLTLVGGGGRTEPRAYGSVTEVWTWYQTVASNGIMIGRGSTRVENEGGAWVGTAQRYSLGVGVEVGTAVWELVGEGGYEGLTMFLWGEFEETSDIFLRGIIVASDSVPDFPPPPEAGAE